MIIREARPPFLECSVNAFWQEYKRCQLLFVNFILLHLCDWLLKHLPFCIVLSSKLLRADFESFFYAMMTKQVVTHGIEHIST